MSSKRQWDDPSLGKKYHVMVSLVGSEAEQPTRREFKKFWIRAENSTKAFQVAAALVIKEFPQKFEWVESIVYCTVRKAKQPRDSQEKVWPEHMFFDPALVIRYARIYRPGVPIDPTILELESRFGPSDSPPPPEPLKPEPTIKIEEPRSADDEERIQALLKRKQEIETGQKRPNFGKNGGAFRGKPKS